jgi:hypothetical protein
VENRPPARARTMHLKHLLGCIQPRPITFTTIWYILLIPVNHSFLPGRAMESEVRIQERQNG